MKKQGENKKKLGFEKQTVRKLLTPEALKNVEGGSPTSQSNTQACSQPDGGG